MKVLPTLLSVMVTLGLHTVKSEKIVIVGAGLAGFSAAAKLIENGHSDIVILEAENRIGGRVHSVPHQNGFIDLGGQFVTGQGNNLIYENFHKYFEFGDLGDIDRQFVYSSGVFANEDQCGKLSVLYGEALENVHAMEKFNGSLGGFITSEIRNALTGANYSDVKPDLVELMLSYLEREVNLDFGSKTWNEVSAPLYAQTGKPEGKQAMTWKTEGFKTVLDFISKKRPDPSQQLDVESKILLNKEVTNIDWSGDKISVTCADGSSYQGDHVIFTASLGVLKDRHATLFTPKLPETKVNAIEHIAYGSLGKVFLEFTKGFWPYDDKEWLGYAFLWTEEEKAEVIGTGREWLLDIALAIKLESFPNTLELPFAGKNMETFESRGDVEIIDDCMWLLEKFLGKKLPQPTEMKRTSWLGNRNFLGTYSFVSVDAERNNASEKDLAETIKGAGDKPSVLFAGEATDSKFSGYTHGAIATGYRAADELIDFFKK